MPVFPKRPFTGNLPQQNEAEGRSSSLSYAPRRQRRVPFHYLGALAFFTVLTAAFNYPVLWHATDAMIDALDGPFIAWVLAWDAHWVTQPAGPLFNANIFYPAPNTLAYSEHMFSLSLLVMPFQLLGGPILAFNALLLLAFLLSGFSMYLLVYYLTGSRTAGLVGGVIFAFFPYRFSALGHAHLLNFAGLPLALYFLLKFLQEARYRFLAGFTLAFTWQLLANWHLALYSVFIVALFLAVLVIGHRRLLHARFLAPLGLAFLLSAIAVIPFYLPYAELRSSDPIFIRSLEEVLMYRSVLADYLIVPPENFLWGERLARFADDHPAEHMLFPGVIAPLLAILGTVFLVLKRPRLQGWRLSVIGGALLAVGAVAFVFTLGPSAPTDKGAAYLIRLPYLFLYDYLPGFSGLRVPSRWILALNFSLAVLAGFGVRYLLSLRALAAPLAGFVLLALLFEYATLPKTPESLPTVNVPLYSWLASQPSNLPVVELPGLNVGDLDETPTQLAYATAQLEATYNSTRHWRPLLNGYSGYEPAWHRDLFSTLLFPYPSDAGLDVLRGKGVNTVLFFTSRYPRKEREALGQAIEQDTRWKVLQRFGEDYILGLDSSA